MYFLVVYGKTTEERTYGGAQRNSQGVNVTTIWMIPIALQQRGQIIGLIFFKTIFPVYH